MKVIIEDEHCSYIADWSKMNIIEEGWEKQYHPSCVEVLDSFTHLLKSVYSQDVINEALAKIMA